MPVAAVPNYFPQADQAKQDKSVHASPGLRFGLLLSIWTSHDDQEGEVNRRAKAKSQEGEKIRNLIQTHGLQGTIELLVKQKRLAGLWEKSDADARNAWEGLRMLGVSDKNRLEALIKRQKFLAGIRPRDSIFGLEAEAVAPFTTGLGNEHPLENGFAFLDPYGLPYLAGSGVKGIVRRAAQELASGEWGENKDWSNEPCYTLTVQEEGEEKEIPLSMIDVLFGRETPEGERGHVRGVLNFWDVIPQINGDKLLVEVMTPHFSHYYQPKESPDSRTGSTSPHESGQPTPICFLTVPPGSRFRFYVECNLPQLRTLAPDLAQDERWKDLLEAAFRHAFEWVGFGAKKAVGYGAMRTMTGVKAPVREEPTVAGGGAPTSTGPMGPNPPGATLEPAAVLWRGATVVYKPGPKELEARWQGRRTMPIRAKALDEFLAQLPQEKRQELMQRRSLQLDVVVKEENGRFSLAGVSRV